LTVINIKQRNQLRLFYKNKKYLPLNLRAKQTRAIRRRLSPEEKGAQLEKTKKRNTHFPQRKYAVKVCGHSIFLSLSLSLFWVDEIFRICKDFSSEVQTCGLT